MHDHDERSPSEELEAVLPEPVSRRGAPPLDIDLLGGAGSLFADDIDDIDGSGEATVVTGMPYEVHADYTGRGPVLTTLLEVFDRTRSSGELSLALLVGEPGMGKSRTIKELCRSLKQRHPYLRMLTGSGDGSGVAYAAFARLLARRFGITPGLAMEAAQQRIIEGVSEVLSSDRVTEVAHLLAHLMRVPLPDSPVVGPLADSPQQLETRMFIALRRFIAADAGSGPLVLILEDLEQCSPESINLMLYLAAGLRSSPVLIVGTTREMLFEDHPGVLGGDVPLERVDLCSLSDVESVALLGALCRPLAEIPAELAAHARGLGGSPRAIHELIRLLLESDILVRSGPMAWTVDSARLAATRLPTSYEELVVRRLEVMDPAERKLLAKAAVIGETFWLDAVVALVRADAVTAEQPDGPPLTDMATSASRSRAAVYAAVGRLIDREWLIPVAESSVPGEREYRFAYPHLWATVSARISDDERHRYHRTAAKWLELRPEGRAPTAQEDIARHLELAGMSEAAAMRYRRAADAARQSYFNDRAIRLYQRALACLGAGDLAARIHIWHDLGSIYELKGDFDAALDAFERMLRLAWVVAARSKAAVAFNKMGRVWRRKGDLKLALAYLERGAELFERSGDGRGIAGSLDDIGKVLYLLGRYDEAYDQVTAGLERRGRDAEPRSIAISLSNLGNIQRARGRFSEARSCHHEALELRREAGDRWGVIASQNNIAVLDYERGDYAQARTGWMHALSEAESIGALPLCALALSNLGELALIENQSEEARRRLEEALEIATDIDDRRLQIEAMRNLALLENSLGNQARARELAHRSHHTAWQAGLRDAEARAHLCLGRILSASLFDADAGDSGGIGAGSDIDSAADADMPPAEKHFERGVRLLRELGHESELARGLEQYGRYKLERGDLRAGKDLLREALLLFSKLDMKRGEEVERLLATLTGS